MKTLKGIPLAVLGYQARNSKSKRSCGGQLVLLALSLKFLRRSLPCPSDFSQLAVHNIGLVVPHSEVFNSDVLRPIAGDCTKEVWGESAELLDHRVGVGWVKGPFEEFDLSPLGLFKDSVALKYESVDVASGLVG